MSYEQKNMTGSLFRNTRKEKDTHPDYSGSIRINGRDLWMSGRLREDKNGQKYFSLAFKPKDGTAYRPVPAQEFEADAKRVFPDADLDDSVPF